MVNAVTATNISPISRDRKNAARFIFIPPCTMPDPYNVWAAAAISPRNPPSTLSICRNVATLPSALLCDPSAMQIGTMFFGKVDAALGESVQTKFFVLGSHSGERVGTK